MEAQTRDEFGKWTDAELRPIKQMTCLSCGGTGQEPEVGGNCEGCFGLGTVDAVRSGPDLRPGDTLILTSKNEQTARWGRGGLPTALTLGGRYVVTKVEAHSWHTLVWIVPVGGVESGPFNEALFTHDPSADPHVWHGHDDRD